MRMKRQNSFREKVMSISGCSFKTLPEDCVRGILGRIVAMLIFWVVFSGLVAYNYIAYSAPQDDRDNLQIWLDRNRNQTKKLRGLIRLIIDRLNAVEKENVSLREKNLELTKELSQLRGGPAVPGRAWQWPESQSGREFLQREDSFVNRDTAEPAGNEVYSEWQENKGQKLKSQLRDLKAQLRAEKAKVYYNLGLSYDESGMYKKALAEYRKALKITPNDPDIHYNLGVLYDDHIKNKKKAIYHYKMYLKLAPHAKDASQVAYWIKEAEDELEFR